MTIHFRPRPNGRTPPNPQHRCRSSADNHGRRLPAPASRVAGRIHPLPRLSVAAYRQSLAKQSARPPVFMQTQGPWSWPTSRTPQNQIAQGQIAHLDLGGERRCGRFDASSLTSRLDMGGCGAARRPSIDRTSASSAGSSLTFRKPGSGDLALLPQAVQSGHQLLHAVLALIGVYAVEVEHVHVVGPQTLEAVLQRRDKAICSPKTLAVARGITLVKITTPCRFLAIALPTIRSVR